ncbi:MAG: hypothetical protein JXA21_22415 [Anaerolineae bacterium]|nr:hypothetical protein [Anaerolineae bacterium]
MTDMRARESLGKRIGQFIAWVGTLFVIVTAVLVAQRLSSDSLALLVGLSCGVSLMMPTLLLGVWLWRREESRRQAAQAQTPTNPSPPVIVVTPQALPAYMPQSLPNPQPAWHWDQAATSKRTFTVVGGEE